MNRVELTRGMVEEVKNCGKKIGCSECPAFDIMIKSNEKCTSILATALLEEMDKPKVWDDAPDKATQATVNFYAVNSLNKPFLTQRIYTCAPPKDLIDLIAEACVEKYEMPYQSKSLTALVRDAIVIAMESLK